MKEKKLRKETGAFVISCQEHPAGRKGEGPTKREREASGSMGRKSD